MLFDATLVVGAIKDNRALFIHIGDGIIGYFNDNEIKILSKKLEGAKKILKQNNQLQGLFSFYSLP